MFPEASEPLPAVAAAGDSKSRARALGEVFLCSGYPTQLVIWVGLAAIGILPNRDGSLSPTFIFALSGTDTVLLLGLVFLFMRQGNDRPTEVLLGGRSLPVELGIGLSLVPALLITVVALQLGLRLVAPHLHNVTESPFALFLESPWLLAGFLLLLVVAGAIREEIQRAFLLYRFEQHLGGKWVGLVVTSLAFGLGHTLQGWDAALVTSVLGASWAAMYLARRSVAASVASHAAFNVAQALVGYVAVVRA